MSRVAKAPITLPTNVELNLTSDSMIVKGPKGELAQHFNKMVLISKNKESNATIITFAPASGNDEGWKHAGTARALLNNMIKGVTEGYTLTLELNGVGYRAQTSGKAINLSLGFSHPIDYKLPAEVSAETPNNTTIVLKGINKQLLGQVASEIIQFRPPEPYKGKGIKKAGQQIPRKEAKKK